MVTQGPQHISRIYIKASPETVWDAITDPHKTQLYYYDARVECDEWKPGATIRYLLGDQPIVEGHLLEVDPPHRLVHSFMGRWDEAVASDRPSRMAWEINPQPGGVCEVRVINDGFDGVTATFNRVSRGMTYLLSALKTVVETGQRLEAEP